MYIIVIRLIWIFYEKIAEEGDNPANNPNICNVTGDNRWSPGVQLLTTGGVLKIGFFSFRTCIFYTEKYFVVFCKTKHSNYKDLKVSFSIIKQLLPSYELNIQLATLRRLFPSG